ncbi:MAG: response regulator [Desulfosoma sp.]
MKGTVLVVALEEDFRSGIKVHLQKRGYRVLGAADQAEAVGLLDLSDVDVVVWHCFSGDRCGWILMDHVRTLSPAPPVILLVPKGQVQHGIEGMKRGAFDDLLIPFAWENLEETVEAAIKAGRKAVKNRKSLRPWEKDSTAAEVPSGTGGFQTVEEQEKGQDQRGK